MQMQQATLEIERPDVRKLTQGMAEFSCCDAAARMLVVDDDAWVVRLLAEHCARIGFDVETAADGLEAFLKASRRKPDILVIDIKLPELDGLSVCAHLLDADKVPLSVIVITGGRDPNAIERCKGFGAHYVRKGPHFWDDLEDALVEIDPLTAGRIGENWARGPAPAVRSRPRVLLIDDDNDVNRLLACRLEKCGIDLAYADDAAAGFQMACRDHPAVIVTDYCMPNGDAQYLLTRLRGNAATSNTPVIVLSGRPINAVADQRLRRNIDGHPGAAHVLRKSEDNAALFETLKKFCGMATGG